MNILSTIVSALTSACIATGAPVCGDAYEAAAGFLPAEAFATQQADGYANVDAALFGPGFLAQVGPHAQALCQVTAEGATCRADAAVKEPVHPLAAGNHAGLNAVTSTATGIGWTHLDATARGNLRLTEGKRVQVGDNYCKVEPDRVICGTGAASFTLTENEARR
ncbi:hypothetical protein ACX3U9_09630 [Corynebacterium pyruviciproducens]|uniref:Uncharacterized protein n=1 Tax=Corynebacterium pyruviciproducens ATCC BAA-1742 TaxID=1125779 RepID=S2Z545_9CORY|nr:hypothetical protein [Corynebacterium pyruviciproducens]EPD69350.1 hypothetical protein HMPREF1219_01219 [Corynebacterium pyruviciproducens ATCC BAA-1742]